MGNPTTIKTNHWHEFSENYWRQADGWTGWSSWSFPTLVIPWICDSMIYSQGMRSEKASTLLYHCLLFLSITTYIWGLSKPTVTTSPQFDFSPLSAFTFCFSRLVWKGKHAAFSLPALHTWLLSINSCFYNLQANVFYLHPILSMEDAAHLWQDRYTCGIFCCRALLTSLFPH